MLADVWREHNNLIFTCKRLFDAVNVMTAFLIAHEKDVTNARLSRKVTNGTISVVDHEVGHVHSFNLGGGDDWVWVSLQILIQLGLCSLGIG